MVQRLVRICSILLAIVTILSQIMLTLPVGVARMKMEDLGYVSSTKGEEIEAFRLLTVEGTTAGGDLRVQSCQYLIRSLLRFSNWNNQTHTSYIELLTKYSIDECIGEARPFWKGDSTKANLQNEIINFLGQASSNEIAILCIQTDGSGTSLYFPSDFVSGSELLSWLQAVNTTTCVVIDACNSGSFISDGEGGILGPGRIVLCSSLSNQVSVGISQPYVGGYFMGFQYVGYPGGPSVGVIGATIAGTDADGDGWLSFSETFAFAKNSVEQITNQDPVSFNGLPDNLDPSFMLLPPDANFFFTPTAPRVNKTVLFNALESKGNLTRYEWNFGDNNIITTTEPKANHTYTESGNYTVTLNVTDRFGQSDTIRRSVTVEDKLLGDINDDDIVDIFDAIILANAYNSGLGDPNWNFAADLNSDNAVDIYDAISLANHYNEHYP